MKNLLLQIIILLVLMFQTGGVWAKHVPQSEAQQVAVAFFRLNNNSGIVDPKVQTVSVYSRDDTPTLYIFRFISGGFVLVAADDASVPVLGYSFENNMPEPISDPAVADWVENYSREIRHIIICKLSNAETLKKWDAIRNGQRFSPSREVLPLVTTVWGQHCYYNEQCPADPAGPCGHVWTGCVATSMAQIMEYHNFPPQGVGQHTYTCPNYGQQAADFENTYYDWASMADSLTGSNPAVATLMYHAGIAVDMEYGHAGSGADATIVPWVLENYFNYSPGMEKIYLQDYPDQEEFKNLLREDLDAGLPVLYDGFDIVPWGIGHQLICDGYRMSDSTFHFNWGMGGLYNGYFLIGHLNAAIYNFDYHNSALIHIKPNNPDLIVRITNPDNKTIVNPGSTIEIKAKVVRGSSTMLKIYMDDFEKTSALRDSVSFLWNIEDDELGSHVIKAYACNSTDTVWYEQLLNVSEWMEQASGFPSDQVWIYSMSAVDSNIVWACPDYIPEFTRTINGGTTWTPGVITNLPGLGASMIFGISAVKAYAALHRMSGNSPQGIYMTSNGGSLWTRQTTAYNNPASWCDVVHFYDANEGFAIGDPINNEYEIYRTTNGGNNWILLPGTNIPDPLAGEFGINGYYSVVQDTIWFGTSMGRVFRSVNKGLNWTVAAVPGMTERMVHPVFRNGSHGLVMDELWGTGKLYETFDGGITWQQINYSGANHHGDIAYVPGTPNTWVRSDFYNGGAGSSYSFDGGHTWTDFPGTLEIPFYPMTWLNNHCGWAGGSSKSSTEGGVFKFTGWVILKPAPENVQAIITGNDMEITWETPDYDPVQITLLGYNIRRNGTKLNASLVTDLTFTDQNVPDGQYTYCVTALYNLGASEGACKNVEIVTGIICRPGISECLQIYPNPSSGVITIETPTQGHVSIMNIRGQQLLEQSIYEPNSTIDISTLPGGLYLVKMVGGQGVQVGKFVKE
jgi:photosystem II stability/assembly factor-like uncharacterized protein